MKQYTLTERGLRAVQEDVRQGRIVQRNSGAFARGQEAVDPLLTVSNTQWLRVTSVTSVSGYYPALIVWQWNGTIFASDLNGIPVWVSFPKGYVPSVLDVSTNRAFFGRQDTDFQGAPAFASLNCPC